MAKVARGEIRQTVIDVMKANHMKSSDQGTDKFESVVPKALAKLKAMKVKKDEIGVRSIMNFVCRNAMLGGTSVARKNGAKKAAKKSAKSNARKPVKKAKKSTPKKKAPTTPSTPTNNEASA